MTVITRDAFGLPTDVEDPLGNRTTTDYDGNHNPIEVTDGAGHTTALTFDAENQRTEVERAGETQLTDYDDNGLVVAETNPRGKTTTYERDAAGRVTTIVDPISRETTQAYDAAGRLTAVNDALSLTTTYAYDDASRLTGIDYSSSATPDVTFDYDADGRRTEMTDGTGASTYGYDTLDRLTSVTNGTGDTVGYGYDLADQRTSITYPNQQTVTRTYDADGRLDSITDWLANTTELDYDADANRTATRFPGAVGTDEYTYDANGWKDAVSFEDPSSQLASIDLTRNGAGQVTGASTQGLPGGSQSYDYDAYGRLKVAGGETFAYDPAGNPATIGDLDDLAYDDADQLLQATSPGGLIDFDVDAVGNRTAATPASGPATTYDYDQVGRLVGHQRAGDPAITYDYDGDGLRASKTQNTNTSEYTWDPSGSVPLLLSDGDASYLYDDTGLAVERIDGAGDVAFLHHDQLGSTRLVTDEAGQTISRSSYTAYGKISASTGPPPRLGFAGEYTDPDTGLIYLRARDYDPATGQFLTRDPLESLSAQPYLYAGGDPLNSIDPLGLLPSLSEIGMAASNAAAGALDGASFGISTRLAGGLFGFSAQCADWGAAFGVGTLAGGIIGGGKFKLAAKGAVRAGDEVASTALVPARSVSGHAAQQMADRGITSKMVDVAIQRGTRYYDVKNRTFSHVLEGGFASGRSLTVATDPLAGRVVTAIPRSRPFNPSVRLPDGRPRYLSVPGG